MKNKVMIVVIFFIALVSYFVVGTKYTLRPQWTIDYFNPMADTLRHFRLDIVNPTQTYDLIYFREKWYAPWGILPALFLVPLQLIKRGFVPTIYISVLFSAFNISIVYALFSRLRREFLPELSFIGSLLMVFLYAFGTTHFYVGTLGSSWHVDQIVSTFFANVGLYSICKKKRELSDYIISASAIGITLLGRATLVLTIAFPLFLYVQDYFIPAFRHKAHILSEIGKTIAVFGIPLIFFSFLFFSYNYVRFQNSLEYGYNYIQEASNLQKNRETNGIMSIKNFPINFWYMTLEIPALHFTDRLELGLNLMGNSIFFLTPPFLAIFLASPLVRKKLKWNIDPILTGLWLTCLIVIIPSLLIYSTGWMQFGYRYSLDITLVLLLLSAFGVKGKLSVLYLMGIIFAVIMHFLGIQALF